jgi:hypothetical protein
MTKAKKARNTLETKTKREFVAHCKASRFKTSKLDLITCESDLTCATIIKKFRAIYFDDKDFKAHDYSRVKRHIRYRIVNDNFSYRIDKVIYSRLNVDDFDTLTFTSKTRVFLVQATK